MRVLPQNLTVVMQGQVIDKNGIDNVIINNIQKVKRHFPASKIIISTWKMPPSLKVQFEKIASYLGVSYILNDDPGCISKVERGIKYVSNVNRMIVSSFNGIMLAKTAFVVKMRTDSYFTSDAILHALEGHIASDKFRRDKDYSIFDHLVLNYNLFSRNARGYLPYLFHPGDILFCGYKNDVLSIFDINLADEAIFKNSKYKYIYSIMDYVPEQYIWTKCIEKKKKKKVFHGNSNFSKKAIAESEKYYMNNFVPFDGKQLSFCWEKHKTQYYGKGKYSVYNYLDWIRFHRKYISGVRKPFEAKLIIKNIFITFMIGYFYIRTALLSVYFVKKIAIRLFNKRG